MGNQLISRKLLKQGRRKICVLRLMLSFFLRTRVRFNVPSTSTTCTGSIKKSNACEEFAVYILTINFSVKTFIVACFRVAVERTVDTEDDF